MPDSEDPKQVNNNDLRNSQFGGGFINAETVNAGRIGGDIYNIHLGQQTTVSDNSAQSQNQRQRSLSEKDSLEKAYTLQSQKVDRIRNAWVIETDPLRKFQYEQNLQEEEWTLRELGEKLDAVERQLQDIEIQTLKIRWEVAKHTAIYALEELKMIDIETKEVIRGLAIDEIPNDDNHCIKLEQPYRLHINFPSYIGKNFLLINESVEGNKYLICPSKAFAEVPYTLLSENLYLPFDNQKAGRAKSLKFKTEGEEYFLAILTEKPIELSWVNAECPARDVELNQERLKEIFIKVGEQMDSHVFYKRFQIVE